MRKDGKKPVMYDLESKINQSVFPGLQGGPHNNQIAAIAVCLKEACSDSFKDYQKQVIKNASTLAAALVTKGYKLVTGGTDNHLLLWDLKPTGIDGARAESVLDYAHITVNKNTVVGDSSALVPGGVRVGAPACTTRGMKEKDFVKIADFLDRGVKIAIDINKKCPGKKLNDFKEYLSKNQPAELKKLADEVKAFATEYPIPGWDVQSMKYKN